MNNERGQHVYELVNEGAGMTGLRIGLVVKCGPKSFEVLWESGHRQRYPQGYGHKLVRWADYPADERARVEARINSYMQRKC